MFFSPVGVKENISLLELFLIFSRGLEQMEGLNPLFSCMERSSDAHSSQGPSMLHGDLSPKNVLLRKGRPRGGWAFLSKKMALAELWTVEPLETTLGRVLLPNNKGGIGTA